MEATIDYVGYVGADGSCICVESVWGLIRDCI